VRDTTRGGVATILNELAEGQPWGVLLEENDIPLSDAVSGVSELLGLDPLYSANEGKAVLVVPVEQAEIAVEILRCSGYGKNSAIIGRIAGGFPGKTVLQSE